MSEYTPTEPEMRAHIRTQFARQENYDEYYEGDLALTPDGQVSAAEFDRWLAAHDAAIEAYAHGYEEGRGLLAAVTNAAAVLRVATPPQVANACEALETANDAALAAGLTADEVQRAYEAARAVLDWPELDEERAKLQGRIEELEKNLSYEVEQKIKLADTLRDERAKRPDREQIETIIADGVNTLTAEQLRELFIDPVAIANDVFAAFEGGRDV